MTRFIVVPAWQGSGSARAMRLADGAEQIAGDLPASACVRVDVPAEAGVPLDTGVARFSAVQHVRDMVRESVVAADDATTLVVGGDNTVVLGALDVLTEKASGLALVWLSAHAALHTPETTPSGAFSSMTLRAALGEGMPDALGSPGRVDATRVVIAGARDLDVAESAAVVDASIATRDAETFADHEALGAAVAATGAVRVFVHVDLDVLDPADIAGVSDPVPFGVRANDLVASLKALRRRIPLAGSAITGFAPASPAAAVDDLGTILRIVGALA